MLVIGRGAVLIGMSERTTPQGVEFLAQALFNIVRRNASLPLNCQNIAPACTLTPS